MNDYQVYSRDWVSDLYRRGKRSKYVFFWGHKSNVRGDITKACSSQWWPCRFTVKDEIFVSAEHWMMAEKARLFKADDIRKKILSTKKPGAAKALGRQILDFDAEVWDENKYDIVVKGNFHKFSQNPKLKQFLIGTGKRVLVEASPVDKIWGIGLAQDDKHSSNPLMWKGQNLLGFALMSTRDLLIQK